MAEAMKKKYYQIEMIMLALLVLFSTSYVFNNVPDIRTVNAKEVTVSDIPKCCGKASIEINNNVPMLNAEQHTVTKCFVKYSKQDKYDRPGTAKGCLGLETLYNDDRAPISSIKPVGWHTKKYPNIVSDRYIYNRCHLLMQAAAAGIKEEQCNSYKNLITGTRYLNVDGMLPYEIMVHSYIEQTGNHVMYSVTPVYKGHELVARGVQMEAYSIEDNGDGVCFNVYCYNIQPGIKINYKNGNTRKKSDSSNEMILAIKNGASTVVDPESTSDSGSSLDDSTSYTEINDNSTADDAQDYVLNKNSKRIHYPWCNSVSQMKEKNKWPGHFSRQELIDHGYVSCGECHP